MNRKSRRRARIKPERADAVPQGAVRAADVDVFLRFHYYPGVRSLPRYYVDQPFVCQDCGTEAVWTAGQQKWWYEKVGAYLDSHAVRCAECRATLRAHKAQMKARGADLLGERCDHLRALGNQRPPTAEARAEVAAALENKWWSLRVVAIGVLGRWGGPEDTAQLDAFVAAGRGAGLATWERAAADAADTALRGLAPVRHTRTRQKP